MKEVSFKVYEGKEGLELLENVIRPLLQQIRELCHEHDIAFIAHAEVSVEDGANRIMNAIVVPGKPTSDTFVEIRNLIRGNQSADGGLIGLLMGMEGECQCANCKAEREEARKRNLS